METIKSIELYKHKDHLILIAAIPFKQLKDIVTFTQRGTSDWYDNKSNIEGGQYYQRPINSDRVKKIKKYINDSLFSKDKIDHILFPSSTILSFDLDDSFLDSIETVKELVIPTEKESCLIVDGQHRMKAMMELYNEAIQSPSDITRTDKLLKYKFNCTILVGYDLWEQAQIFASVNFNQKPVDRSLYFDIFGSAPKNAKNEKLNNLYVAHELGKILHSSEKSPLKGFVKNFTSKDGFYSQAFFTQQLVQLLGFKSVWNRIIDDYKLSEDSKELYKSLPKIFVAYFNVIREMFPSYWPKGNKKEHSTLLVKTTSMGAFLRLLGRINELFAFGLYPNKGKIDLTAQSKDELQLLFREVFQVFDPNTQEGKFQADTLFGDNSLYKGGGSVGLQSKLYRDLARAIGIPTNKSNS